MATGDPSTILRTSGDSAIYYSPDYSSIVSWLDDQDYRRFIKTQVENEGITREPPFIRWPVRAEN